MFEIYTSIRTRYQALDFKFVPSIPIHNNQRETRTINLMQPNFFNFNLAQSLENIFDVITSLDECATKFESEFWPFQFDKKEISKITKFCVKQAINFIVLHECSHILRGHIDYLSINNRIEIFPESGQARENINSKMAFHMEIDADLQAIATQVGGTIDTAQTNTREYLTYYMYVIAFLYASFDFTYRTVSGYEAQNHPDPDLRYDLATARVITYIREKYDDRYESILTEGSEQAIMLALKVQRECGIAGGGFTNTLARSSTNDIGIKITKQLTRYYEEAIAYQNQWSERLK